MGSYKERALINAWRLDKSLTAYHPKINKSEITFIAMSKSFHSLTYQWQNQGHVEQLRHLRNVV